MKICIVAHFAYGAISGGKNGHAGGVERQTSLLARWLAAHGHQASLLTWDEGQGEEVVVDGVRVIKMCHQDAGLPGVRFFYPRWTSLIAALRKADAELYYQNCAEYVTGQVALWCKSNRRSFAYSSANNPDCDPRLPELRTAREKILFRYGLKNCDRVIVQTNEQKKMILDGWRLDSTVLPMPCPGPGEKEFIQAKSPEKGDPRVVWVGRITKVKRLEYLLDVAEQLPKIQFDIAGKPDIDDNYSQWVLGRADSLANVTVHGKVPREKMPDLYRRASALCCTSIYEGFPNTFLEAWSHGLPIVSTYDADSLIARLNLGIVGDAPASLAVALQRIFSHPAEWQIMSANARAHYLENYTVDSVMTRYEKLFLETIARGKAQP